MDQDRLGGSATCVYNASGSSGKSSESEIAASLEYARTSAVWLDVSAISGIGDADPGVPWLLSMDRGPKPSLQIVWFFEHCLYNPVCRSELWEGYAACPWLDDPAAIECFGVFVNGNSLDPWLPKSLAGLRATLAAL